MKRRTLFGTAPLLLALLAMLPVSHAQTIFADGFEGSSTSTIIEVQVSGISDQSAVTATLNGAESLRFIGNGTRAFNTLIPHGTNYTVTLVQQSGNTPCRFSNQANGMAAENKITVTIDCGDQSLWDVMHWDTNSWQ